METVLIIRSLTMATASTSKGTAIVENSHIKNKKPTNWKTHKIIRALLNLKVYYGATSAHTRTQSQGKRKRT